MLKNLTKRLPRDKNRRFAVLLIALLALPITVVLVQRVVRYFTGAASATVYFEPSQANLPPDTTLRLMVNSDSTQVGFARVEVNFDRSKVRLTSEVSTTGMLTMNNADVGNTGSLPQDACTGTQKCIIKTPMNAANNTGKIILVLAKDPRVSQNAPSGTFELARFTFTPNTSQGTTTTVSVPSNQLVDTDSYKFAVSTQNATLRLNGGSPGDIITNLQVNDSEVWNVMTDLQTQNNGGDHQFSDRSWYFTSVPSSVAGSSWIQTANDSKNYTGTTIATFELTGDATVYIAHDDRISSKPPWFSGWTDSGINLVNGESTARTFSLYSRSYSSGQTVILGPNGGSPSNSDMYTVVAVGTGTAPTNTPTSGATNTPTLSPGECSDVYGDATGEGDVNVLDVMEVLDNYSPPYPPENICANINGDNNVNVLDVMEVLDNYTY